MATRDASLEFLLKQRKVVVLLGAGGVGKTSCSLGLAIKAARSGLKVAILSIDPAKRLAAALGLSLSGQLTPVLGGEESPLTGSLHAAMLDHKAVFDTMVRRHAPDVQTAVKILNHRLYIAASTQLAGAVEYMALAKLQELIDAKSYDLIVLDTPPDSHALDFLSRPNILAGFMENKVMSWLIKPFHLASKLGINRLFSLGERLMGGLARVTGLQALHAMADFLILMQQIIDGFHATGEKIAASLASEQTGFVLVTACQNAAMRSAANLADQLKGLGYRLDAVIFNRCLPPVIAEELQAYQKSESFGKVAPLDRLYERYKHETALMTNFCQSLSQQGRAEPAALAIPEQTESLHHEKGIYQFSFAFE